MTNLARFTVDADPSTNRGIDVVNGATGTFKLETPTSEVWKVTFLTTDATDVNAPLASKGADELVLDNGAGSTGTAVNAATVAGEVTTTWPASGVHSYIVRCKVNDGVNPDGSVNSDYVFERMCSIRSSSGRRKIVATEGTQYSPRGWADAQNEDVDASVGASGYISGEVTGPDDGDVEILTIPWADNMFGSVLLHMIAHDADGNLYAIYTRAVLHTELGSLTVKDTDDLATYTDGTVSYSWDYADETISLLVSGSAVTGPTDFKAEARVLSLDSTPLA